MARRPALLGGFQRITTKNILAPLLTLSLISGGAAASVAFARVDASLAWGFLALFALTIGACLWNYHVWSNLDPNRLQSEDYQLEMQRLIGDERNPNSAALLEGKPVANPGNQE